MRLKTLIQTLEILFTIGIAASSACSGNCPYYKRLYDTSCRDLTGNKIKTSKTTTPASCAGVASPLKVSINCPVGPPPSGATYCTTATSGSGFLVIVVPQTGGVYSDSAGFTAYNCNDVLNFYGAAINGFVTLNDIVAVYSSNASQVVSCNATSCTFTATSNCLSAWDPVAQAPTTTPANIPLAASNYIACAYIDAPQLDPTQTGFLPPAGGQPANATSADPSFGTFSIAAGTLNLNTWTDF